MQATLSKATQPQTIEPRDRLIVALDVSSVTEAEAMITRLGDSVSFYKIGYQLGYAGGLALAADLARAGKKVFVDLKLHDIGNTVARGVESVAQLGATFLTVHAYPQTMTAAVDARAGSNLKILAVTVLTSLDRDDLADLGYPASPAELVALRVKKAVESKIDGIVCSALEVAEVRRIGGPDVKLVIPGVRSAGASAGDQKRVATPAEAMAAGVDYLVIGRQVTRAEDPRRACEEILAEIRAD